ncbi:hypothetical protein LZ32DRAFT_459102 [Colletotrichum eremochloae]|nr:hypothetical protein LZ32DRAFT_459102 [Colletotrichum eremochloae]
MGVDQADAPMFDGSNVACLASVFPRPGDVEFVIEVSPPALPHHLERPVPLFHHELAQQATNDSARSGGTSSVANKPSVRQGGWAFESSHTCAQLRIICGFPTCVGCILAAGHQHSLNSQINNYLHIGQPIDDV